MENDSKKTTQKNPSPAVVSTGCSNFKSCLSLSLSLCRHLSHTQPPPLPPNPTFQDIPLRQPFPESSFDPLLPTLYRDGEAAAQAYWRRARQLEHELRKLDRWLSTEKKLTESLKNTTMAEAAQDSKLMRLADGSYLHEVKKLGRPWGRLVMQVSTPTIAENSSTAFEVLCSMASMKIGDLYKCLRESMSMGDISGCKANQLKGKFVAVDPENDFMEAILSGAVEKMEGLALEGLLIQMGTSGRASEFEEKSKDKSKDTSIVVVVLIQVRDPKENYEAVGEPMIGFVEASSAEAAAGRRSAAIQGVHVAGMKCTRNRADGRDYIWSASLKGCHGPHNNCCWQCVRNPDRLFA